MPFGVPATSIITVRAIRSVTAWILARGSTKPARTDVTAFSAPPGAPTGSDSTIRWTTSSGPVVGGGERPHRLAMRASTSPRRSPSRSYSGTRNTALAGSCRTTAASSSARPEAAASAMIRAQTSRGFPTRSRVPGSRPAWIATARAASAVA